jgi:hypothetical protein
VAWRSNTSRRDKSRAKPKNRLSTGIWLALTTTLVLLSLGAGAELYVRFVAEEPIAALRARFRTIMTVTRWRFLEENFDRVKQDDTPSLLTPNERTERPPEPNRPPFDGIARGFTFETNADGFRDPPFPSTKQRGVPRVLLLGDSISFGKGVDVE